MLKALLLSILVTVGSLAGAQATVATNVIHIQNHGGWSLTVNIGADRGDKMSFDVKCDHDIEGKCLVQPPTANGVPFVTTVNKFRHQHYSLISPTTTDQIIEANYWWVGAQVHYKIAIVAAEALN